MEPASAVPPPSRLRSWFSNPIVGFIGTIASVIGLLLAFYFYYSGERERGLSFYVHPVKTIVVKGGQSSTLRILHNDREIRSDVSSVQFEAWNQGSESIRPENVLRKITVSTKPRVPILEARILKSGRAVSEIAIDASRYDQGILELSWRILEHNDGAIIQLVYAGSTETALLIEGIIEGQTSIKVIAPEASNRLLHTEDADFGELELGVVVGVVTAFYFGLWILLVRLNRNKTRPSVSLQWLGRNPGPARVMKFQLLLQRAFGLAFIGSGLTAIYLFARWLGRPRPPFPF